MRISFVVGMINIVIALSQVPIALIGSAFGGALMVLFHLVALVVLFISGILVIRNKQIGWMISLAVLLLYLFVSIIMAVLRFPRDGLDPIMPNLQFYILYPPNGFFFVLAVFIIQFLLNLKLNMKSESVVQDSPVQNS